MARRGKGKRGKARARRIAKKLRKQAKRMYGEPIGYRM